MKLSASNHPFYFVLLFLLFAALISALPVKAQQQQEKCPWGDFEAPLPLFNIDSICTYLRGGTPLIDYINAAVDFITGLIVVIGIISILVGGYFYMTAGGSAERVGTAKTIISSALAGIVIAMVGWVMLNTISPQFASDVKEPKLILCKDDSDCAKGNRCVTKAGGSMICEKVE